VNAKSAKISNAKKWAREAATSMNCFELVDPYFERDFLVINLCGNYDE
jgi:hypothetical protein